jgi:hypothetical protein
MNILKKFVRLVLLILAFGLTSSACKFPVAATPEVDVAATQVAQAVEAFIVEQTEQAKGTPQVEESPLPSTETPLPTETEVGPSPTSSEEGCIDKAAFVTDVSIPDDTPIDAGDGFTKTWRIRNEGTCTWTSSYSLVFSHGDLMGGPSVQPLAGAVPPGAIVDLSVNLHAPISPGVYQGFWKLRNNAGVLFGVGPGGDVAIWVKIKVLATPTPTLGFFVITPLPLLHVDFELTFENVHTCGGWAFATFKVKNIGNFDLEAANQHIIDLTTAATLYGPLYSPVPYMNSSMDCPVGADTFGVGTTRYIGATIGPTAPSGHNGRAIVKMCTKNDMTGLCVEKQVEFTFP